MIRAIVWFVEAAALLAWLFVLAFVWVAAQVWDAFMSGLDGTPWASGWRDAELASPEDGPPPADWSRPRKAAP